MYTSREDDANIKLTDFGLALLYPGASVIVQDDNLVGTPGLVRLPALYGTQLIIDYDVFLANTSITTVARPVAHWVRGCYCFLFGPGKFDIVFATSTTTLLAHDVLDKCTYHRPACLRFTYEVITLTLPVPDKIWSHAGSWPIHHSTFSILRTGCVPVPSAGSFTNVSFGGVSFEMFQCTFGDLSCNRLVADGALNTKRCLSVCVF